MVYAEGKHSINSSLFRYASKPCSESAGTMSPATDTHKLYAAIINMISYTCVWEVKMSTVREVCDKHILTTLKLISD